MEVVVIIICVAFSAFFSASETALTTVNKIRLKSLADNGDKRAARTLKITQKYDKTLTTILIGNNIVNIASASLGTVLFTRIFGSAGAGISTVVMTLIVLTFGEIMPKTLAKENADKIALAVGGFLDFLIKLFTPLSAFFMLLKKIAAKAYKKGDSPSVTEDELKYIINEIEEEGVLEEQESDLVRSALDFDETTVAQILVPRVKICAVEKSESIEDIKQKFLSEGYSRMPVYEDNIDNIVGIINEKDFFRFLTSENKSDDFSPIITKAIYFTEFLTISEALKEMQQKKQHIAIISDQYGGTSGIVTMEDIIEELVGDIYDESDEVDNSFVPLDNGEYEVDSSVSLHDFEEKLDLPDDSIKCESNTVGGWAMELFGKIPEVGEKIKDGIFTLKVISADESHVGRLLIKLERDNDNNDNEKK